MPKQINSHEHYKINRSRKGNKLKLKIIPSNFLSSNISHKHLENDFDVDDYSDRKRDDEDDTSTTSSKMIREITYVFGSNFSLNNQCEYRIKIYVTNTVIIQEQFLVDIQTNIFISQMDNFCMFLQINNEESFHKEFKLYTEGFIHPSFHGNLHLSIKNIGSHTRILYPSDIIGFLVIQPFILKDTHGHDFHHQTTTMKN